MYSDEIHAKGEKTEKQHRFLDELYLCVKNVFVNYARVYLNCVCLRK